ncbi:MAG: terpene cyclase/mutase family protein [Planctomycetes bacterium]|nr:terpene cyclase/mutase family protein [Planctomycetota bacterium]
MRRAALACLAVALASQPRATAPAPSPLEGAVHWLLRRQQPDGSWRSERYAVLRSGQAMTPFTLRSLLDARELGGIEIPNDLVERALGWIRRSVASDGSVGYADGDLLEYPLYSTALALEALCRAGGREDRERIERMARWLCSQQCTATNGFPKPHPAHGAFPFGSKGLRRGDSGFVDLSHTRRALQALGAAQAWFARDARGGSAPSPARPDLTAALHHLAVLQKLPEHAGTPTGHETTIPNAQTPYDGGFYNSTVVPGANKGGLLDSPEGETQYFASYATATADGVLALVAAGVPREDRRVRDAASWLESHPRLDRPAGIPEAGPDHLGDSLRIYHLAARAEALNAVGASGPWRDAIAEQLAAWQQIDGSFRGVEPALMKEDDPLLATALAASALARTRSNRR